MKPTNPIGQDQHPKSRSFTMRRGPFKGQTHARRISDQVTMELAQAVVARDAERISRAMVRSGAPPLTRAERRLFGRQ